MPFRVKRVYEGPEPADGIRVLVDRVWPRGFTKEAAAVDRWVKELGPSHELRTWFGHDASRWREFRDRYFAELEPLRELWEPLVQEAESGTVSLVYSARDTEHNQAVALQEFLDSRQSA